MLSPVEPGVLNVHIPKGSMGEHMWRERSGLEMERGVYKVPPPLLNFLSHPLLNRSVTPKYVLRPWMAVVILLALL
jgi:hypothetical protein